MRERQRLSERAHGHCWRRFRTSRGAGRSQRTSASARNQDRAVAENVPTTFSFHNLHARARPGARGKSQDADKAGRIFLVVAVAHGERGQIGAVERVVRLTAYYRDVSFI